MRPLRWVLLLLILPLLSGCTAEPQTTEAAQATARAFMQARTAGDVATLDGLLTARAQRSISRTQISRHSKQFRADYASLGEPQTVESGVLRIPVYNLTLTDRERSVKWPESWLTLRYEGERWRVAWTEPLIDEAAQAYENGRFLDQLHLGQSAIAIDPYHYRGYLELHYAYRGLKRHREAEAAIVSAMERATPVQLPDVHDAMARFKLSINAPAEALAHARRATELAAPYMPNTYSTRWQADTLVVAGRAALAMGDRATAESLAKRIADLDPDNANLAILRYQLAAKPSQPPPAR